MASLMTRPVLVLNATYESINICSAKRAMKLLVKDVAVVEQHHEQIVHSNMFLPSVIRLKDYRRVPVRVHEPSRKNIYTRDHSTCQYCHKVFKAIDLTLDHIMPKSRGGKNSWDNLVASCQPCNRKKADRTPEEAGMALLVRPRKMTIHTSKEILRNLAIGDPMWEPYLYFENTTVQAE